MAQLRGAAEDGIPRLGQLLAPQFAPSIPDVALDDPALTAAAQSVARVSGVAFACGITASGSGFVVAPDRVMTNAHVVAGVDRPVVELPGREAREGRVVYFDPVGRHRRGGRRRTRRRAARARADARRRVRGRRAGIPVRWAVHGGRRAGALGRLGRRARHLRRVDGSRGTSTRSPRRCAPATRAVRCSPRRARSPVSSSRAPRGTTTSDTR